MKAAWELSVPTTSRKIGAEAPNSAGVRFALGPRKLDDASAWIEEYRRMLEDRLNRLDHFLERTRETS